MNRLLLVSALGLAVAAAAPAQTVPLDALDQAGLRERVREYLLTAEARELLAPVADLVEPRADQITYEAAEGRPARLVWGYTARAELDASRRALVRQTLGSVLDRVLRDYRGGLLAPADADSVAALLVTTPVGRSAPAPARVADAGKPPRVIEPATYWTYYYHAMTPPATHNLWWPAYSSAWPTYGTYAGATYWPMQASGYYSYGYAPFYWGYYPWQWNSWPIAGAWSGPYYYTWWGYPYFDPAYIAQFRANGYAVMARGYATPTAIPYVTPIYYVPGSAVSPYAWTATTGTPPVPTLSSAAPVGGAYATSTAAGPVVEVPPTDGLSAEDVYSRAVSAYRNREYTQALALIDRAVALSANDPRFWYVKAVTERALGVGAAEASAQRAAALEVLTRPTAEQIGSALETIQGPERRWVRNVERLTMTVEQARQIVGTPAASGNGEVVRSDPR